MSGSVIRCGRQGAAAWWIGVFGVIALLMAAVGLYGVIAQTVAQRSREIGIRIALGASAGETAVGVVRRAVTLACLGIAAGVPAAIAGARLARVYLQGIGALEPSLVIAAATLLLGVPGPQVGDPRCALRGRTRCDPSAGNNCLSSDSAGSDPDGRAHDQLCTVSYLLNLGTWSDNVLDFA